jgi:pimeloyl-ACP methyl ester carboxylesterase
MAQEMLDTMHPMTKRDLGTVNVGTMIQRKGVSRDNVSAPTLILHAKDDALVSYNHAVAAHEAIKHSRLICFDSGGHGRQSQMSAVRQNTKEFLGTIMN